MEVRSRVGAEPFTTLDGSTIRVLLDAALGGAANQSLAEASLDPGRSTQRHYHARSEEIYAFLEGVGWVSVSERRSITGSTVAKRNTCRHPSTAARSSRGSGAGRRRRHGSRARRRVG